MWNGLCDQDPFEKDETRFLAERIISDYMGFVCTTKALEMWLDRKSMGCDSTSTSSFLAGTGLNTRKRIIELIENDNTLEAFYICERLSLFDANVKEEMNVRRALSRLVFVSLVKLGKNMDAVEFVRKFLGNVNRSDKLLTLIGYKDLDDKRCREIMASVVKDEVIEMLNRHLFKKEVGREQPLLLLAINHYNSVVKQHKMEDVNK